MTATAVRQVAVPYSRPRGVPEHVPQLDGLRALAVVLVIVDHTAGLPGGALLGIAGVTIFFVLSAYLITGILLRAKGAPLGQSLRIFYARRALRIIPAYALFLIVLKIVHAPTMDAAWPWHALYLSNWYFASTGALPPAVGHLWTLSIEEQFYLCWPLLVLLLPFGRIGWVALAGILIGVASRGTLAFLNVGSVARITPTTSVVDAFALGALLAWQRHQGITHPRALWWGRWIGWALFVIAFSDSTPSGGGVLYGSLERFAMALIALHAVGAAADNRLPRVFTWRPLRFVGTISYGLYLWHGAILWAVTTWTQDDPTAREAGRGGLPLFAAVSALTLGAALLSWYGVERPINQLKRYVPYRSGMGQSSRHRTDRESADAPQHTL